MHVLYVKDILRILLYALNSDFTAKIPIPSGVPVAHRRPYV